MEMQTDLLTDIHDELNYEEVSAGIRFANYLIDIIVFYILSIGVAFALASVLPLTDKVVAYLVSYILYVLYYTIIEGATQGRSVGKMLTGCTAIKEDNTTFTFYDALMRSLSRIVPFEPFSAFGGHPWHDRWTNTKVVKMRR